MRKTLLLIFIIFFLIACAAQNKSSETDESMIDSSVNTITLPKVISIGFPSVLENVSNSIFTENLQSIKNIINIEKRNLNLLEEVIDEINEKCLGLTTCHIKANSLFVEENNERVLLGDIDFNTLTNSLKYQYALRLKLNNKETVTFKWSDLRTDVLSMYEKEKHQLNMHYFRDTFQKKEALSIDENLSSSQNSVMIALDSNSTEYRLRSNYIDVSRSFSSNILIQNEVLLEENENIYDLNNDYTNIDEGSYMLFSSMENVENLNLLELFEKSLGSFLLFDNKLQGFTYNILSSDISTDEALIPVRISTLD